MKFARWINVLQGLFPVIRWLPKYNLNKLQCDAIAGVTVGLMVVPQALAYASVAGLCYGGAALTCTGFLDPVVGLYSSFIGPFVYFLMGSAKDITLGPTAIMSLLVSSIAGNGSKGTDLSNTVILSVVAGMIQVLLGTLKLGFLVEFISFPVINGFTSSAAIVIVTSELKHILGLTNIRQSFIYCLYDTFSNVGQFKIWDLALGLVCILSLLLLQEMNKVYGGEKTRKAKIVWFFSTARNALVIIIASIVGFIDVQSGNEKALTLISKLPKGLPIPSAPPLTFDNIGSLFMPSLTVALIGFLESIAIAKAFARQNGYEVDSSQELIAIGSCNIFGSFFSSYPVTGSFSRTAVNSASGVKTPLSGLFTSLVVIFSLLFLTELFHYIPQAALGAIIICAVIPMIEYEVVLKIWRLRRWDIIPYCISFFGCLIFDIQYGITAAVGASMLFLLYHVARPDHRVMTFDVLAASYLALEAQSDSTCDDNILVFRFGGNLLYPAMTFTKEEVLRVQAERAYRALVLDFTCSSRMDYTGVQILKELVYDLESRGVRLYAVCVSPLIAEMLGRALLLSAITVCPSIQLAVNSARAALAGDVDDDEDDGGNASHALIGAGNGKDSIQTRWTYSGTGAPS